MREYPYAVALQVCRPFDDDFSGSGEQHLTSPGIHVTIPTLIRMSLAGINSNVLLRNVHHPGCVRDRRSYLSSLAGGPETPTAAVVRLMTPNGQIYAEATVDGTAGDQVFLQQPLEFQGSVSHSLDAACLGILRTQSAHHTTSQRLEPGQKPVF